MLIVAMPRDGAQCKYPGRHGNHAHASCTVTDP